MRSNRGVCPPTTLSSSTWLAYRQQCPTHRKEYAADRSESIPHGVIKTKTPTQLLHGGSVRENPVYHVLLYHRFPTAKSGVMHTGSSPALHQEDHPPLPTKHQLRHLYQSLCH